MGGVGTEVQMVFDRADLLNTIDGDVEIMEELVGMFLNSVPEQIESIRTAIGQNDFVVAVRQAHKLKGTAANLRASFLHTAYADLEDALKERDLPRAMKSIAICTDGFGRFKEVFEQGA